jgi:hypothetical protein
MILHPVDPYTVGMKTPNRYQIQVQGHFDEALAEWFAPLSIANQANGDAILTGPVRDQAELYGILLKLYNLNFTLIAVQRVPVSLIQLDALDTTSDCGVAG